MNKTKGDNQKVWAGKDIHAVTGHCTLPSCCQIDERCRYKFQQELSL